LGGEAVALLTEDVPAVVNASLSETAVGADEVLRHALTNEDADALRESLGDRGWIAFVADGSSLPRISGIDDRPLSGDAVVRFTAPANLSATVELPNTGSVTGMALPRGVSLVVGGGYHGKSTLLRALEAGVYNHCPGDGREFAVSDPAAIKIRAEDGRSVSGVDISPFIDGLPQGQDTRVFSTPNASGSTSQAASIMEALEVGATTLLIDEDTAATNFMIRDRRMQALVPKSGEPITPFVDRVRTLWEDRGVSSVIVLGGSGDYLDVADTVVAMKDFQPHDVTAAARRVAEELPTGRHPETPNTMGPIRPRAPLPRSVDPSRSRRAVDLKVRDRDTLVFGRQVIDLSAITQLVSRAQTRAVGRALVLARESFMDGQRSLSEIADLVARIMANEGLDALDERRTGDLAAFRPLEFACALNRLRTLEVNVNTG
jgi:predicted ABC-class ATPase